MLAERAPDKITNEWIYGTWTIVEWVGGDEWPLGKPNCCLLIIVNGNNIHFMDDQNVLHISEWQVSTVRSAIVNLSRRTHRSVPFPMDLNSSNQKPPHSIFIGAHRCQFKRCTSQHKTALKWIQMWNFCEENLNIRPMISIQAKNTVSIFKKKQQFHYGILFKSTALAAPSFGSSQCIHYCRCVSPVLLAPASPFPFRFIQTANYITHSILCLTDGARCLHTNCRSNVAQNENCATKIKEEECWEKKTEIEREKGVEFLLWLHFWSSSSSSVSILWRRSSRFVRHCRVPSCWHYVILNENFFIFVFFSPRYAVIPSTQSSLSFLWVLSFGKGDNGTIPSQMDEQYRFGTCWISFY